VTVSVDWYRLKFRNYQRHASPTSCEVGELKWPMVQHLQQQASAKQVKHMTVTMCLFLCFQTSCNDMLVSVPACWKTPSRHDNMHASASIWGTYIKHADCRVHRCCYLVYLTYFWWISVPQSSGFWNASIVIIIIIIIIIIILLLCLL